MLLAFLQPQTVLLFSCKNHIIVHATDFCRTITFLPLWIVLVNLPNQINRLSFHCFSSTPRSRQRCCVPAFLFPCSALGGKFADRSCQRGWASRPCTKSYRSPSSGGSHNPVAGRTQPGQRRHRIESKMGTHTRAGEKKKKTVHDHNTRGNHVNLSIPKPNTNFLKNSLAYNGAVAWNSIPTDIRYSENIEMLKKKLTL